MSCLRFSQSAPTQCRNSQPGITTIYIANFSDKVSYTTNTSGDMISGMTWSGATGTNKAFYSIAQNKQVASCIDTPGLNIANGTFIMKPQVIGKVQGMETYTRSMYQAMAESTLVAVIKTIDSRYYIVGIDNGLDMTAGTYGTEAAADGFKGFSFTLEGLESKAVMEIDPTSIPNFVTTYVI